MIVIIIVISDTDDDKNDKTSILKDDLVRSKAVCCKSGTCHPPCWKGIKGKVQTINSTLSDG